MMIKKAALLIIDVQNDFCPGGALAVTDGDRVIAPLNRLARHFTAAGLTVVASRDWHPPETNHFIDFGGEWPIHCVAGTIGAEFPAALELPTGTVIIFKGIDPALPGYSAFEGFSSDGTPLAAFLRDAGVEELFIGGLATDYCVLSSVLDARQQGFAVTLLNDAVAAVNISPGDAAAAIKKMEDVGAHMTGVDEVLKRIN